MDAKSISKLVERARGDQAFFEMLRADPAGAIQQSDDVAVALRSGVVKATGVEHGAYSGCNATSCGCGGSI